jgi:hypothetical protein
VTGRVALVVLASLHVAAADPKDSRRIVGVLDVHVEGVPADVAATFQKNIEQQVDPKHYAIAPRSRMKESLASSTRWTEGCVVGSCLAEVKAQTNADLVLLAALTGTGTSFGFVVTLVRTDTGRVLAQESGRCDVCTVNEAMATATLATVKLLGNLPDTLPDETAERRAAIELAQKAAKLQVDKVEHHGKRVGIALTAVGLAAVAAGVALYAADNHADYAAMTATAGGGLALGGIAVLTF